MYASLDQSNAFAKLLEITLLRRVHRMGSEERDDRLDQILAFPHHVPIHMLAVVVVTPVGDHATYTEERTELVETRGALRALRHGELMRNLIAGPVAASARPRRLPDETDREASFSVYKTNNPAGRDQSFLLIVRTLHIVTIPNICTVQ